MSVIFRQCQQRCRKSAALPVLLPRRERKLCGRNRGRRNGNRRARIDLQSTAKERQASKLAEIREALVAAGYDTTAKQAAVLGVCRATAWVVLNRDKRVGPSASVIKRILSSPNIPPAVRHKVEEYIQERISGLYGIACQRHGRFVEALRSAPWLEPDKPI